MPRSTLATPRLRESNEKSPKPSHTDAQHSKEMMHKISSLASFRSRGRFELLIRSELPGRVYIQEGYDQVGLLPGLHGLPSSNIDL